MNDQRGGISLSSNQMAVVLMVGYVVLMSFVPLFVALGGGGEPVHLQRLVESRSVNRLCADSADSLPQDALQRRSVESYPVSDV